MRRILSERNLVVILFVVAFVVFIFAQHETKKVERMYMGHEMAASSSSLSPSPSSNNQIAEQKGPGSLQGVQ